MVVEGVSKGSRKGRHVRISLHSDVPAHPGTRRFPIYIAAQRMPIPHTTHEAGDSRGFAFSSRINNVCRSLPRASLFTPPLLLVPSQGKEKQEEEEEEEEQKEEEKNPALLLSCVASRTMRRRNPPTSTLSLLFLIPQWIDGDRLYKSDTWMSGTVSADTEPSPPPGSTSIRWFVDRGWPRSPSTNFPISFNTSADNPREGITMKRYLALRCEMRGYVYVPLRGWGFFFFFFFLGGEKGKVRFDSNFLEVFLKIRDV